MYHDHNSGLPLNVIKLEYLKDDFHISDETILKIALEFDMQPVPRTWKDLKREIQHTIKNEDTKLHTVFDPQT